MYGICTYIWVIYGVNVGKYTSTMDHLGMVLVRPVYFFLLNGGIIPVDLRKYKRFMMMRRMAIIG